ncbi:ribosomal protein S18 acetylase RimI-like enzyme [Oxalobacteraceae bacterium GrIS 2.11]
MNSLKFKVADPVSDHDDIKKINIEYITWVSNGIANSLGNTVENLVGMSIPDYVEKMMGKICGEQPPRGIFYLVEMNNEIAGMVGLRHMRDGVAEIKRLYIRPAYRGRSLGRSCLRKVLADASEFGYQTALLDTAPFMYSARRLYASLGFKACEPYADVEVPVPLHESWVFLECDLQQASLNQQTE